MKILSAILVGGLATTLAAQANQPAKRKLSSKNGKVCGYELPHEKISESAEPGYSVSDITQEKIGQGADRIVICSGEKDGWRSAPVVVVAVDKNDKALSADIYPVLYEGHPAAKK